MPRFDLDAQRGLVCLFGMAALTAEGIGFYITGKTLPDIFTGGFISMVMGPLLSAWAQKYQEAKQLLRAERAPSKKRETRPPTHGERSSRERKD